MADAEKRNYIVLKFGTEALKYDGEDRIDMDFFVHAARKISEAYLNDNFYPLIVSSGAVFMGMNVAGITERPKEKLELQSIAGVGQAALVELYREHIERESYRKETGKKLTTKQVVVTHDNLEKPDSKQVMLDVVNWGYPRGRIAIFNENDVISDEELRERDKGKAHYFGDNDMLSYLIAKEFGAVANIIFTPKGGLYDEKDQQIDAVLEGDYEKVQAMVDGRSQSNSGRGGIVTKVEACIKCAKDGIVGVIADSKIILADEVSIKDILATEKGMYRTFFPVKPKRISVRRK